MKRLILIILFVIGTTQLACAVTSDKVSHFASSAGYGLVADTILYRFADSQDAPERMVFSALTAFAPGLAIEVADNFDPGYRFSWGDLLADGVGAVTGVVASELVNGQLWLSASGQQIRLIGRW